MTMTDCKKIVKEAIQVNDPVPAPLGNYSHAIRTGNLLFVSGQGCRDPHTGIEIGITLGTDGKVTAYDIKIQTEGCIKNLERVLKAAGLGLTDLVDMTIFLADMKDFAAYNEVYSKYFSFPSPPARTTIQAAALPGRNYIEIKAIAAFPNQ